MTQKEKSNRSLIIWLFAITMSLIIFIGFFIYFNMPHEICHKEYKVSEIKVGCNLGGTSIPANVERICEEGVQGEINKIDYESIVWYCGGSYENYSSQFKKCMLKEEIKVCEIK